MTFVFRQHHGHPPAILVMGQPATSDVSRLFLQHRHLGWLLASLARQCLVLDIDISGRFRCSRRQLVDPELTKWDGRTAFAEAAFAQGANCLASARLASINRLDELMRRLIGNLLRNRNAPQQIASSILWRAIVLKWGAAFACGGTTTGGFRC